MEKSLETHFILFIHKTLLSFSYLERQNQRLVLRDLQKFIHRLTQLFQTSSLHPDERRLKIIEILVKYLQKLHKDQISHLISHDHKDELLKKIEKEAYQNTMKHLKRVHFEDDVKETEIETQTENQDSSEIQEEDDDSFDQIYENPILKSEEDQDSFEIKTNHIHETPSTFVTHSQTESPNFVEIENKVNVELRKLEEKMIQKVIEVKRSISNMDVEMDRKMEIRIKSNFIEIENQIKKCIRDSLTQLYKIEGETVDKMDGTIRETKEFFEKWIQQRFEDEMKHHFDELYQYMNTSLQESMKSLQKIEGTISERMDDRMEEVIQDIYEKLKDNFKMLIQKNHEMTDWKEEWEKNQLRQKDEMKTSIQREFEDKLQKLSQVFHTNFSEIIQKIHDEKLKNSSKPIDLGTFHLDYNQHDHQINLIHNQDIISSIKLNVKGMIGPKGPQGLSGKPPKIKKVRFSHDGRVKFLIEGDQESGIEEYEVESEERVPSGPQGPKGEKGDAGTIFTEMKLNEKSILRVDHENLNNLVVMKSLCIGEDSHCLQDKSLAIGGGVVMRSESLSLGKNARTSDYQSVAIYGTTHGKNAFSYRAQGVNDNEVRFGQEKNDIERFEIKTKRFVIDADEIEMKGKVVIQALETKIANLEKKIQDLQRRL